MRSPSPDRPLWRSTITAADVDRFAPVVERLTPRLYAWVRLRIGRGLGRIETEDVVQEIWCRVLTKLADAKRDVPPADGWVFETAKYVLLESMRRSRKLGRVQFAEGRSSMVGALDAVPAELTTMTRRLVKRETLDAFVARVDALDDVDQRVFVLCGLEQLPHADVAAQLGMQRDAVTKRWARLRDRMRGWEGAVGLADDAEAEG